MHTVTATYHILCYKHCTYNYIGKIIYTYIGQMHFELSEEIQQCLMQLTSNGKYT